MTEIMDPYADYPFQLKKELLESWHNAEPIPGADPLWWRRDADGNCIFYTAHEARDSKHGWRVIRVESEGKVSFRGKHLHK